MLTIQPSIITVAGVSTDDVRYATMTMLFINSSLRYDLSMANMIHQLIFLGNFLKMLGLEQLLVNSLILLMFGG
jgi:hypothetical protein